MIGQEIGVALIVFLAVGYIVWKLTGSRRPRRRTGPDVPASRLARGSDGRTRHGSHGGGSCHG